jgi:hypothetical protein
MGKAKYTSDITLGERYRDEQTGFEGVATSITFFQYACERIALETYDATRREVKTEVFDAPRLTSVKTNERATTDRTGGPQMPNAQRGALAR